jgi:GNAT superfamily N-acetyltransferase
VTSVHSVSVGVATESDAASIATLRTAVAEHLTRTFGQGHWSSVVTDKGVLRSIQGDHVLVARGEHEEIVGTLRLATKKPWAINKGCFADVRQPLYLTDMAVAPHLQRRGIGRQLLQEATAAALGWPADAIRLDAYDSVAGAGPFYAKCGYREVGRATYRNVPLIYFELLLSRRV